MSKQWTEQMEALLEKPLRSDLVAHLIQGLRDKVDAESFQELLEKTEETLQELNETLFESSNENDKLELDSLENLDDLLEALLENLSQNFTPECLTQARRLLQLQEEMVKKAQSILTEDEEPSYGTEEPVDKMLLGLLLGAGIGTAGSMATDRSLLAGVLLGGAVGLCAGALVEVLADELI